MTIKKQEFVTEVQKKEKEYIEKLSTLGFSENEALLYVTLLKLGKEIGGTKLAAISGLHRQYVYLSLPNLLRQGLVEEVGVGTYKKYKAQPPVELEMIGRRKALLAGDLAKELNVISNIGNDQDFEVIQGVRAIQQYEAGLVSSAGSDWECYIIGGGSVGYSRVMGDYLEDHLALMKKKNLSVKYIGSSNERSMYDQYIGKFENQEYRFMEKLPEGVTHLVVRKDTVSFYSFLTPPLIYVVKSPVVAKNYKQFFMMLWEMAGGTSR
jgi:predicted transcriptional regulator